MWSQFHLDVLVTNQFISFQPWQHSLHWQLQCPRLNHVTCANSTCAWLPSWSLHSHLRTIRLPKTISTSSAIISATRRTASETTPIIVQPRVNDCWLILSQVEYCKHSEITALLVTRSGSYSLNMANVSTCNAQERTSASLICKQPSKSRHQWTTKIGEIAQRHCAVPTIGTDHACTVWSNQLVVKKLSS